MDPVIFMSKSFQRIGILGGGLLGGSIALALRGKSDVRLWFRKPEAARTSGLGFATGDLAGAVTGCDLLILAVPVGAMPALLTAAIEAGLPSRCVVTDVGSVKKSVHDSLATIVGKSRNPFIGSHPMAGSERNGLPAARAGLFENAACLLTNDSGAEQAFCDALGNFWESLGCRISWLGAAAHDELVARISHLPHLTAAATAKIALRDTSAGKFGGGGLRDTTRVASGNPEMWAEILTENREAVIPALKETIAELCEILATLEKPDQELAQRWLADAKALRDTLK